MNIYKKDDCFELWPKTYLDCEFIDYLDDANGVLTGNHNKKAKIGEPYEIRAFKMMGTNQMENKMIKGEIIKS